MLGFFKLWFLRILRQDLRFPQIEDCIQAFNDRINAIIGESSATLPPGGEPGQMPIKTEDGIEWGDASGGGVIEVADAAARFALTGLGRLATVYQEDNGFYYQLTGDAVGVLISGAGTAAANGIYTERGVYETRPYYNLVGAADDSAFSSVRWTGDAWRIMLANGDTGYGNEDEDVAFPWLSAAWAESSGDSPAPTVTQVATPEQSPTNWTALPKVYSANFFLDGYDLIMTREQNGLDVGISIAYVTAGRVDATASSDLFDSDYVQYAVQSTQSEVGSVTFSLLSTAGTEMRIFGFIDGVGQDAAFGGGGGKTTGITISQYPEPD